MSESDISANYYDLKNMFYTKCKNYKELIDLASTRLNICKDCIKPNCLLRDMSDNVITTKQLQKLHDEFISSEQQDRL
tara:strand:+ start:42 stop:275 length:234 start_codon:yes stop_codon:yes gene_type:complete